MSRWLTVIVLVLLVLTSAMGLKALSARHSGAVMSTSAPVPPPWATSAPVPPPW